MAVPGTKASDLYEMAATKAREAGFEKYFMGHRQHAAFCGHGIGIEINESPVIAPRSRDILQANNAIAMEPKFVIPHVGAVGIENTYIVTPEGGRCITNAPEEILPLD
jgi:Xaa-Pro aminopeptidase